MVAPPKKPGNAGRAKIDDDTVTAVEILHEAVMGVRTPGGAEFKVVSSALQRVIENRQASDLAIAEAAFDRLDGDVRASIAENAVYRAEDHRRTQREILGDIDDMPKPMPSDDGMFGSLGDMLSGNATPLAKRKPVPSGAPLIAAMSGTIQRKR